MAFAPYNGHILTLFVRLTVQNYYFYFIYANNSETDKLIGYKSETSQFAIAEMHVVTFGRGTNAIFKMWTCKSLDLPPPPWKPIDEYHIFVESSTWITGPDK